MDPLPPFDLRLGRALALTVVEQLGLGVDDLSWVMAAFDPSIDLAEVEPLLLEDRRRVTDIFAFIATQLWVEGLQAEGKLAFERALRVGELSCGPEHPEMARLLIRLVSTLDAAGKLAEARPLLERALRIYETA